MKDLTELASRFHVLSEGVRLDPGLVETVGQAAARSARATGASVQVRRTPDGVVVKFFGAGSSAARRLFGREMDTVAAKAKAAAAAVVAKELRE